jgi:SWIM zinc finger
VSPPRRVYGTNPPGRLAAAMLRALAAEIADPGRFARAKAYARDGAVVDIVVEPGEVRGSVQGSRFDPYLATVYVEAATDVDGALGLLPDRDEVLSMCSCPDDDSYGWCKHALAVLLVLADEVTIEPAVLGRWRSGRGLGRETGHGPAPTTDERPDVLAPWLRAPAKIPDIPVIPPRVPVGMAVGMGAYDTDVAAAVASALAELRAR